MLLLVNPRMICFPYLSRHHLNEDAAQTPNVRRSSMTFTFCSCDDFRCHVCWLRQRTVITIEFIYQWYNNDTTQCSVKARLWDIFVQNSLQLVVSSNVLCSCAVRWESLSGKKQLKFCKVIEITRKRSVDKHWLGIHPHNCWTVFTINIWEHSKQTQDIMLPAVPRVLFTSPGMVWALFLNLTEQPKSPSFIRPEDVRKMFAPDVTRREKEENVHKTLKNTERDDREQMSIWHWPFISRCTIPCSWRTLMAVVICLL